jgi:hypothetical protein
MTGNFRGKRLFAGRLFAGRLFGPTVPAFSVGGGSRRRVQMPRWPADSEDDLLLLVAAACVAGAGVLTA